MATAQLTLFEFPPPTLECLDEDMRHVKEQLANLRKGLFQRYDNLNQEISQLKADMRLVIDAIQALEHIGE